MKEELEYREVEHMGYKFIVREDGKEIIIPERVSDKGRTLPKRVARQNDNGNGYLQISIDYKKIYVHRLVALAFVDNDDPVNNNFCDHLSGDRQDNRKENIRWVTQKMNIRSFQKPRKVYTSIFRGVNYDKKTKKWRTRIGVNGKDISLGHYEDELDAAAAYNSAAIQHGFNKEALNPLPENYIPKKLSRPKPVKTSKFRGVHYCKNSKKWRAGISYNKKQYYLGVFAKEEDAANAYNRAAREYGYDQKLLNELPSDYTPTEQNPKNINKIYTSKYTGVHYCKNSKKWRADIRFNNKQHYLGYYLTELEATKAYNKFIIDNNLDKPLNIIEEEIEETTDSEFNLLLDIAS